MMERVRLWLMPRPFIVATIGIAVFVLAFVVVGYLPIPAWAQRGIVVGVFLAVVPWVYRSRKPKKGSNDLV